MRLSWLAFGVVLGLGPVVPAMAQGLLAPTRTYGGSAYQSPQDYRPPTPSSLDKDYGLPSFGAPGGGGPKQRAPATERKADAPAAPDALPGAQQRPPAGAPADRADQAPVPDFFSDTKEIALPKTRRPGDSETDTPLYTTSESSGLDDMDTTGSDTMTRSAGAAGSADADGTAGGADASAGR